MVELSPTCVWGFLGLADRSRGASRARGDASRTKAGLSIAMRYASESPGARPTALPGRRTEVSDRFSVARILCRRLGVRLGVRLRIRLRVRLNVRLGVGLMSRQ